MSASIHSEGPDATTVVLVARTHPASAVNDPKSSTTNHDRLKLADQTNLLPFRNVVAVFAGLSLCIVVSTMDAAIMATALPTISAYFNAGSVASWVPSAYMLTSTSFQPLYGRFSDIFGRKAALRVAMSMFMIGNLIAGFSKNIVELIVWRGVAGVGGGGIMSLAQIIVSDVVSLRERGKYDGIIGGVIALGYAFGPSIGGILSEKVTWRWCFWVNLPVSLAAICIVIFVLPLKPVEGDIKRKLLAIDYLGCVLSLVGSALLILPLIWGGVTFPWNSPVVLAQLCSGVLVMLLFCFWEWKGAKLPIIPMYIFKHVTVTGVCITVFINGFIFFSSIYYIPQFFVVTLGSSPIQSGVLLSPLLVSHPAAGWLAGMIVSRTGRYRTIVYVGFAVWAAGCCCISTVKISTPKALLIFYMLLTGTGAGQTLQTTLVAAQASVPRKDMSVVTVVRAVRYIPPLLVGAMLHGSCASSPDRSTSESVVRVTSADYCTYTTTMTRGTLSLAVGSTLINNSLRSALVSLGLSPSAIKTIVDNPALLGSRTPQLALLGLDPERAAHALTQGYMRGFRWVFVLNASLAGVATLVSILMIKHKELVRGDEDKLREEAKRLLESRQGKEKHSDPSEGEQSGNAVYKGTDVEIGG